MQDPPLSFQKRPAFFGKVFFVLATAGVGLGVGLEDLTRLWIPQSSFGPKFRIRSWYMQNHSWGFLFVFYQESLPYQRNTYLFLSCLYPLVLCFRRSFVGPHCGHHTMVAGPHLAQNNGSSTRWSLLKLSLLM